MKPTITVDTREWVKAARALKETSSRTTVDFINGQALRTAIEAVRQTEKADVAKIAPVLGATGRAVAFRQLTRGANRGQWRTKRGGFIVREDSLASRILGARMKEHHTFGVKGKTMEEAVQSLIRTRTRSRSFIASGWIWSRNALWNVVKKKPRNTGTIAGARAFGTVKGSAKPAIFSLRSVISAIIENKAMNTTSRFKKTEGNPQRVAAKGLQAAVNFVARDMAAELVRRLTPDFKKVSAK